MAAFSKKISNADLQSTITKVCAIGAAVIVTNFCLFGCKSETPQAPKSQVEQNSVLPSQEIGPVSPTIDGAQNALKQHNKQIEELGIK